MADLPIEKSKRTTKEVVVKDSQIEVTDENAAKLAVHFLAQIYARLGYIVKLLEEKK